MKKKNKIEVKEMSMIDMLYTRMGLYTDVIIILYERELLSGEIKILFLISNK